LRNLRIVVVGDDHHVEAGGLGLDGGVERGVDQVQAVADQPLHGDRAAGDGADRDVEPLVLEPAARHRQIHRHVRRDRDAADADRFRLLRFGGSDVDGDGQQREAEHGKP
jgi:hypothetical protein